MSWSNNSVDGYRRRRDVGSRRIVQLAPDQNQRIGKVGGIDVDQTRSARRADGDRCKTVREIGDLGIIDVEVTRTAANADC